MAAPSILAVLANGLAIVPEDKPGVKPGDEVKVMMLDWSEDVE